MEPKPDRLRFFVCPVCGAEAALIRVGDGDLVPRCCNLEMELEAA
jgi:hypothetical protein